jgi:hypothetical protein
MEARMTAVEADIGDIKGILQRLEPAIRRLELDVAEMKGRVPQLPTSIQMIGLVLAILAISGAMHWLPR